MKFLVLSASTILFFSCSLDYGAERSVKDIVPEFVFINTHFTRYENSRKTMDMDADELEQYASDRSCYAKNPAFTTFDENNNAATTGSCSLLAMDTKNEIYTLYEKIKLKNNEQNMQIIADNLKWNAKTEQLTSGADDYVELFRDDVEIFGRGFSASGITLSYAFGYDVSGTIIKKEETEEEAAKEQKEKKDEN